ncbi:MAG: aminotransferase class III-fold pyridoxal phosphate-dependent enzyme [Phycisphaerae bacterium]|nr:aminotransferase class III-fold pyridoxal phosphate-dependent enzyme [Phycisphaerae bacterium]NUQ47412.1 aminotransferase class III-fold pyridoxal phosphate-dependent enzyme [Phycisphaerae bacterium]
MSQRSALVDTYAQFPLEVVTGRGSRLRTRDGHAYWDFYGGHAVALLGHCHPAVTRAVSEQAAALTFYSNVVPLEIRSRAAQRLCAFAGAGLDHVFFCNSGAEANENALKLAIARTGRTRIASLDGGWHGRTLLALSATTEEKLRKPFSGVLCDAVRLRPNDLDDLHRLDDRAAAVIVEPIQSIAGIVSLTGEYLAALRRRCDDVGAYLIFDEVQTGMGRLGRPFAAGDVHFGAPPDRNPPRKRRDESVCIQQPDLEADGVEGRHMAGPLPRLDKTGGTTVPPEPHRPASREGPTLPLTRAPLPGICPDMATSAKGIANGIPMGALLMNARVAEALRPGDLGSTFGGGPVACAAMLAVIETTERESLLEHAARLGAAMRDKLSGGPVLEFRGRGCLVGLRTKPPAASVQKALMQRGFVTGTSADPHVLRLMPPINTPLDAVDELAEALTTLGGTVDAALA